jgi:hypothetical protein
MRALAAIGMILAMPRPTISSKLLLVADPRRASAPAASTAVRRYRLARLKLESRATDPVNRFEHLKRVFD